MTTTNSSSEEILDGMSRAERRRLWKEMNKRDDYEQSRFFGFSPYVQIKVKESKYTPHVGNKQKKVNI